MLLGNSCKISVVICTYNRAKFLKNCLDSLVDQTADKSLYEVIIINNNSNDNTLEVAEKFVKSQPNFRIFIEEKQGLSYARNFGFQKALSSWVAYIDDDAKAHPNYIERALYIIENYDFDCFGGVFFPLYESSKPKWLLEEYVSNKGKLNRTALLPNLRFTNGGNNIFKKSVLYSVGGFSTRIGMKGDGISYGEETRLQVLSRHLGYKIGFDPELLVDHMVLVNKFGIKWWLVSAFIHGRDSWFAFDETPTVGKIFVSMLLLFLIPIKNLPSKISKLRQSDYYIRNFCIDIFCPIMKYLGKIVGGVKMKSYRSTFLHMYDYVIITNLPSFYKVNLYNKLAKQLNIYVIFLASSSRIRINDFTSDNFNFQYDILHQGDFESRSILNNCIKLLKIVNRVKYKKIIISQWDLLESWFISFTSPKEKNCYALESLILESKIWIKFFLKKTFISRISTAFPSGKLHQDLLNKVGFRGKVFITKGVGIFNKEKRVLNQQDFTGKFLYVGRLAKEKNLELLIKTFHRFSNYTLTIVGSGNLEKELKIIAPKNVNFVNHVRNADLSKVYCQHDVFILPSLKEPWGLVVEEALYYGLPVIVSSMVGCHPELVNDNVGFVFNPRSEIELEDAICKMAKPEVFNIMKSNVHKLNFEKRDREQLAAYVKGLE